MRALFLRVDGWLAWMYLCFELDQQLGVKYGQQDDRDVKDYNKVGQGGNLHPTRTAPQRLPSTAIHTAAIDLGIQQACKRRDMVS